MIADPKLHDEEGRLRALERMQVLDTAPEAPFNRIVHLVQRVLDVPMCAVSLVDKDRQWFKAESGLAVPQTPRDVAFCAHTIGMPQPLLVPDATTDLRFAQNTLVAGPPHIRSYAGIPLRTPDGYMIGSLCVMDSRARHFTGEEVTILTGFARLVQDELELRQIASTDHLTGALSRRAWNERAGVEIARAKRYGRPLSLAILDIDHFKRVNDRYGHPAGDIVIQSIAELCTVSLRQSDLFGRLGGEEFVLLMPETMPDEAYAAVERIRIVFSKNPHHLGEPVYVTVSIGLASLADGDPGLASLLDRADKALYEAKAAGRNRTMSAEMQDSLSSLAPA